MNMQIDYETERELGIDYETLAVKVDDNTATSSVMTTRAR